MKKIVSVLIAVLLLMSMIVPALAADDPNSISYFAYWCGALNDDEYVDKYVEDALGIEIEIKKVDHTDREAVNLMIAQDMPDCMWTESTISSLDDQEMVRRIPVDMVKEYAPYVYEIFEKYPMLWAMSLDPEDETQLLYIPTLSDTYTEMYIYNMYLRYDWVQALNIDLGVNVEQVADRLYVADKGLSLEVFDEVLRQFVKNDPDGNGQNDTQGYVKDYWGFLSAYGLTNGIVQDEDGNAIQFYTHPKMKDMLNHLQELYAEGLIYPEIFTIGWGEDWELINNNVCGVWRSSTNTLNSWAANRPPLTILNNPDSNATILSFPGICDENGRTLSVKEASPAGTSERFVVRWDVSDEKLAKILEFVNFAGGWNPDSEVVATLWYGEKGVDWDWNEDGSMPISKTGLTPGERGTQVFSRNAQVGDEWRWITFEPLFEAGAKYYIVNEGGIWNQDMVYDYKRDYKNETNAGTIMAEYSEDWNNVRNAYVLDVITGKMTAEEGWDAYIQQLNDLHYGEYLEELNKCCTTEELIAQYSE